VFAFAMAGASVSVGLDICSIAVQAAKDEQQLEIGNNAAASAVSKLISGDFFSHESSPDFQGPYDIGYDYTFLCALHPGQASSPKESGRNSANPRHSANFQQCCGNKMVKQPGCWQSQHLDGPTRGDLSKLPACQAGIQLSHPANNTSGTLQYSSTVQ
jgi:hypothetical protein